MAKEFATRRSKKERKIVQVPADIDEKILRMNDQKLLQGAQLSRIPLKDIEVRAQVRTKFNDDSLRELGQNIKENGLIQPLVIHREVSKFVLICGERRFRAMILMGVEDAPCFILEDKSPEELMAIQFSENQAREELHYIDQADSIWGYKKLTGASERKITAALGISKSEVHRCIQIARLPKEVKEAAKRWDTEKYVLLEWNEMCRGELREEVKEKIVNGEMKKRLQLRRLLTKLNITKPKRKKKKDPMEKIFKELKTKMKDPEVQDKAKKLMEEIINVQ